MFENWMLMGIFGLKKAKVMRNWKKLRKEELHNLSLPNMIIKMKQWRIRWAGRVAYMSRSGMHIRF
jgi:hypothetical protein